MTWQTPVAANDDDFWKHMVDICTGEVGVEPDPDGIIDWQSFEPTSADYRAYVQAVEAQANRPRLVSLYRDAP